ncbi:hypothetical protein FLL45_11525 [Aliikangiella marina]|uniref:Transporter substrate-binding domain-containing protein n=1 Tax=Aliikangiella marina TaxID=1712262 RepID=A0A545TE95_9GAMM|nr:hypothetical protein [Aliikangiella marina]TQV75538.1 hypothetical protein FLL45_11525 [Aliikangiella marina]
MQHVNRFITALIKPSLLPQKQTARVLFLSLATLFVSSCSQQAPSKLEQVLNRGEITVVTRNSPTTYYERADGFAGIEFELVELGLNLNSLKGLLKN